VVTAKWVSLIREGNLKRGHKDEGESNDLASRLGREDIAKCKKLESGSEKENVEDA
jgi:hypothetical protein